MADDEDPWYDQYSNQHSGFFEDRPDYDPDDGEPGPGESQWNQPKSSIWDDDGENTGDGYDYKEPPPPPQKPPQGFWGAGGGGNPWWGAPSPGQRWGDDPTGSLDPRTGQPQAPQGSVQYGGIGFHQGQSFHGAKSKYEDIVEKYQTVRHPGRSMRKRIMSELEERMPRTEAKRVMRNNNWL